jgi:hypothetical protein
VVVQPVPHDESHVFFASQLVVTPFGGCVLPPSAPASPLLAGPNVQVPPVLQEQVAPEHVQSPVHVAAPPVLEELLPPQPLADANVTIKAVSEPTTNVDDLDMWHLDLNHARDAGACLGEHRAHDGRDARRGRSPDQIAFRFFVNQV